MPQVKACHIDELPEGVARPLTLNNRPVALIRCADKVYAVMDRCPHQAASLSDGTVSVARREVICPWHRFRFHLETGASVTNPEMKVRTLPVTSQDGVLYVDVP